jgi:hypothetical protein
MNNFLWQEADELIYKLENDKAELKKIKEAHQQACAAQARQSAGSSYSRTGAAGLASARGRGGVSMRDVVDTYRQVRTKIQQPSTTRFCLKICYRSLFVSNESSGENKVPWEA